MARIASSDIPNDKRIEAALAYVYGVGRFRAKQILKETKISPDVRTKDLSEEDISRIRDVIEKNYSVEGELRRHEASNIKRLKEIGAYRGLRHIKNLPVRGQRTRTNARTKKGRKAFIGGIKKEEKKK